MAKKIISVDSARTLSHVALLAAWEGDGNAAERIFASLQAAMPKEPNIRICRAMVLSCQDKFADSIALLREVLQDEPDNLSAKSLLGFVLFSTGERGWQVLLEEVLADGSDRDAVELAQEVFATHGQSQQTPIPSSLLKDPAIPYA